MSRSEPKNPNASETVILSRPCSKRPMPAQIVRVVTGTAEWTTNEEAWIGEHPEMLDYARRLKEALKTARRRLGKSMLAML